MKKLLFSIMLIIISFGFVGCGKDLSIPKHFEGKYEKKSNDGSEKTVIQITKIGENKYKIQAELYYDKNIISTLEQKFEIIGAKKDREKKPTYISYQIKELGKGRYLKKVWKSVGEKGRDYIDSAWENSSIDISLVCNYTTDITKLNVSYTNLNDENDDIYTAVKKGIKF